MKKEHRSARLPDQSAESKREIKKQIQAEKQQYSKIKKLRWALLTNGEKLTDNQYSDMQNILEKHSSLAVCYAMKEEPVSLFRLRDPHEAEIGWRKWFKAAKESGIPALVHFAELKERRLNGLIAHAQYPISTGKLEGFNNKIKVAKRVGYGASGSKAAKESGIPALVHFAELKERRLNGLIAHAQYPTSTGKLEGFNNKIKVAKRVGYGFRDDHYFFLLVRSLSLSPRNP